MKSTNAQIAECVKALAEELEKLAVLVAADMADNADTDDNAELARAANFVPMDDSSGFDAHVVPPEDAAPVVTLADVRSCLAELSRAGLTDKVRELIHAHGADKLSDVPETEYAALLKEAEELKHGK